MSEQRSIGKDGGVYDEFLLFYVKPTDDQTALEMCVDVEEGEESRGSGRGRKETSGKYD
jgi:hypothetical protein